MAETLSDKRLEKIIKKLKKTPSYEISYSNVQRFRPIVFPIDCVHIHLKKGYIAAIYPEGNHHSNLDIYYHDQFISSNFIEGENLYEYLSNKKKKNPSDKTREDDKKALDDLFKNF